MTTKVTFSAEFPKGQDSAHTVLLKRPGEQRQLTPDEPSIALYVTDMNLTVIEYETVSEWRAKQAAAAEAAKAGSPAEPIHETKSSD